MRSERKIFRRFFEEYDKLAKIMVERERSGRGFTFFHFMIDLEGGPCVSKRLSGCGSGTEYLAVSPWGDLYPCHRFVGRGRIPYGKCGRRYYAYEEIADEFRGCSDIQKKAAKIVSQDFIAAAAVWRTLISSIIRSMIHMK